MSSSFTICHISPQWPFFLYWMWNQSRQVAYWPRAPSTVLVGGRPHHRYRRVRSLLPVVDRALQKTNKLKNKPFSSYVTLWICFLTHLVPLKNTNLHKNKCFAKCAYFPKRLKKLLHPSTCCSAVGGVHVLVWADLCDTPSKGRAGGGQGDKLHQPFLGLAF